MRSFLLLAVAGVALGGAFAFQACSSSTPEGTTPVEADGGGLSEGGPGVLPDGGEPPTAQGDPCRGIELPADKHFAAKDLCARVVATKVRQLRSLTFAPNGDLFGVTSNGSIRLFRDADGDGFFQPNEIVEFGSTGGNGNNCDIDVAGGYLYAGSSEGVKRFKYDPSATSGGAGEDVVVGQPADGHAKHTVHVYDGYLYVVSGSAGNATNAKSPAYDDDRSLLRRFALASFTPGSPMQWSSGEVFAQGLRNMNGFTRNGAGRMYGVVNGLDNIKYQDQDVHNDNPGEQVVQITQGARFGYPFCFTAQRVVVGGQVVAPGTQLFNQDFGVHDDAWCAANSTQPATFIQAHSAPLDIVFFDVQPKGALPERFRGGAFVSLHGSWNRAPATGYKVIWIPFDAAGKAPMPTSTNDTTTFPYETVFGGGDASGPKDGDWSWTVDADGDNPRPVGVAISPVDGALYVASDQSGVVYRLGAPKK